MEKGEIIVTDGVVTAMNLAGAPRAAVGQGTLAIILKDLKDKEGWEPDGELPPFRTTGQYTIKIRKPISSFPSK